MKLLLPFLMSLLLLLKGFSQNCTYKKNEIDKFTGKYIKVTNPLKVISTFFTAGEFSIKKDDTTFSLIFNYIISRYAAFPPYNINKGSQLLFLLENGNQIILESNDDIMGVNTVIQVQPPVYSCNLTNVSYHLTKEQLEQFLISKVKTIRFYRVEPNGKEDYIDCEIKRKDQGDISKLVRCIL